MSVRIKVDLDWCQGNARCVLEAPDVFSLSDDGKAVYLSEVDDSQREAVEAAVDACPTQSIEIIE